MTLTDLTGFYKFQLCAIAPVSALAPDHVHLTHMTCFGEQMEQQFELP